MPGCIASADPAKGLFQGYGFQETTQGPAAFGIEQISQVSRYFHFIFKLAVIGVFSQIELASVADGAVLSYKGAPGGLTAAWNIADCVVRIKVDGL